MRWKQQAIVTARYWLFLLRQFRLPLGVFVFLVVAGGLVVKWFRLGEEEATLGEACYDVFLLIFMEAGALRFPSQWYLQPFFFVVPLVGLGAIADSVVRLGYLIFARKQNLPEWQRIMAQSYTGHIVVVGVGRVGYRIIQELLEGEELVVAVERQADSLHVEEVRSRDVPLIIGDGRRKRVLEEAGVPRAKAIILASDDDLTNLDGALTARELNPEIRVVVRLFDDTLAQKVAAAFGLPAISTSQVSTPAFIAAATGRKVYQHLELGGERLHLVDLEVNPGGVVCGQNVGQIQERYGVNIVMYRGAAGVLANPEHEVVLQAGDTILVIAPMAQLLVLQKANAGEEQRV